DAFGPQPSRCSRPIGRDGKRAAIPADRSVRDALALPGERHANCRVEARRLLGPILVPSLVGGIGLEGPNAVEAEPLGALHAGPWMLGAKRRSWLGQAPTDGPQYGRQQNERKLHGSSW